jgi:hypothetical protein
MNPGALRHLLDDVAGFVCDYVVLPDEATRDAIALWIAHTWKIDDFDVTPYLGVISIFRRCGKTRLLEVLSLLVRRPWLAVLPSEPIMFRKIDSEHPTLLFDEIDTVFNTKTAGNYEGLRALLNAGYRRGLRVDRCLTGGKTIKLESFDVFAAKCLAGIGERSLPDTIRDRAVIVHLARRAPGEQIRRFRYRDADRDAFHLRELFEDWSQTDSLVDARPELPEELDDRAADSWEPLFAVAQVAAGDWPRRALAAALALSASRDDDQSRATRLLADLRDVFDCDGRPERLSSETIVACLRAIEDEEAPWHGQGLDSLRLAKMLRLFDIKPHPVRIDGKQVRGYERAAFADAWLRYLPAPPRSDTTDAARHTAVTTVTPHPSQPVTHLSFNVTGGGGCDG